jgi:hypothetical protein
VKLVVKALLWFLNVVLGFATLLAFGQVGYPLVGLLVMLLLTAGIGYFVARELE